MLRAVEFEPEARVGMIRLAGIELELSELLGRKVDLNTPGFISPHYRERVLAEAQLSMAQAYGIDCLMQCSDPARELIDILERVYCGSLACEHMHITDTDQRRWIEQRFGGRGRGNDLVRPPRVPFPPKGVQQGAHMVPVGRRLARR